MKPRAETQMQTKPETGPPKVAANIPSPATMSATATQPCWPGRRAAATAKRYIPAIEISQGIELKRPTCKSERPPMPRMISGSQNVTA